MKTVVGDLLNPPGYVDAICFTSNGVVKRDGRLVMGAGCAKAFRDRFFGIDSLAGTDVQHYGNRTLALGMWGNCHFEVVSFPTKHHWKDKSHTLLIASSAIQLVKLTDKREWNTVWLPPPGCDLGGLSWENEVKTVLEDILDDRFTIIFRAKNK